MTRLFFESFVVSCRPLPTLKGKPATQAKLPNKDGLKPYILFFTPP